MRGDNILQLYDIKNIIKINWNNFYISPENCQNASSVEFELMPRDYLVFVKKNTRSSELQNRVEGISNAKRAIDCQIDFLVSSLGYDYKLLNNRNRYENTRLFIKEFYEGNQNEGVTDKLKLLNILGLAPTLIISNIRRLRNLVEHEYKVISEYEVKTAVEVADLLIPVIEN